MHNYKMTLDSTVTKDNLAHPAAEIFGGLSVNITTDGGPVLGSSVDKPEYIIDFVSQKVKQWVGEIDRLDEIADGQPHAAYRAITHGLSSKWPYLLRTTPNINRLLEPIEYSRTTILLPKLIGQDTLNETQRCLFSLPTRLGGLYIENPASLTSDQFRASQQVTTPC